MITPSAAEALELVPFGELFAASIAGKVMRCQEALCVRVHAPHMPVFLPGRSFCSCAPPPTAASCSPHSQVPTQFVKARSWSLGPLTIRSPVM